MAHSLMDAFNPIFYPRTLAIIGASADPTKFGNIILSAIQEIGASEIIVERMVETGYERLAVETPCLLTVVKEINYPRLPTLRGKIAARGMDLKTWGPDDIDARPENIGLKGSPTRVVKIATPQVARSGKIVRPRDERELEQAVDGLLDYLERHALL